MALIKTAEMAEFLSVHPDHLYRLVGRGVVPAYRVGDSYRFDAQAVVAALQTVPTRSDAPTLPVVEPEQSTASTSTRRRRKASRQTAKEELRLMDPYLAS